MFPLSTCRIRQNLHNHTVFSDGSFTPARLVQESLNGGLDALGISDHFFTKKVFHRIDMAGWCSTVLPNYLQVAEETRKMEFENLKVWFGLEVDSCEVRLGCTIAQLPWPELNRLDYLLFEYVGETGIGGLPLERLEELRQFARVPIVLAHPNPENWEETLPLNRVFDILRKCGVALELPGGTRNPWPWTGRGSGPTSESGSGSGPASESGSESGSEKCAGAGAGAGREAGLLKNVPLMIGCDTHERIEDLCAIGRVLAFIEQNGLLEQLTDPERLAPKWGGNP